jgi:serine/threonine protein kinase
MTGPLHCPQCGSEIPDGSPVGLCPKCLVLAGLESQPAGDPKLQPTQPSPAAAISGCVPPTVEELAARFPHLEILELLGRGGMGAVYKARQKELDRLVAVKILPPEVSADPAFAERFTREARALARLSHAHIVAVYDFGRTSTLPSPSG